LQKRVGLINPKRLRKQFFNTFLLALC